MDKFDKLIDRHFGVMMSHKAASVQYYLETGNISGTFRMSLRHMLSDACGGDTSEREQANDNIPLVSVAKRTVCDICGKPAHDSYSLCIEHLVMNERDRKQTER